MSPEAPAGNRTARDARPAAVLIADPDPLTRQVVRDAITRSSRFVVASEVASGEEAVEIAQREPPDIALLEIDLPGIDGIAATRKIFESTPEVRVVIVSREDDEDVQLDAFAAGASGFVPKSVALDEILDAIDSVARGEYVVPPKTMMHLIERLRTLPPIGGGLRPVYSPLTQREWEILDLMSQDLDTHQMAEALVVSEETIYSHVKHILRKLQVHSRREAVQAAHGLRLAGTGSAPGERPTTKPNAAR